MKLNTRSTGGKLAVLGGLLAAIAAFLPWYAVDSIVGNTSVSGLDHSDGMLTLCSGIAAVAIVLLRENGQLEALGLGIAGALTTLVGYHTLTAVSEYGGLGGDATASYGLYITLLAGILLVGGALLSYRETRTQPSHNPQRGNH